MKTNLRATSCTSFLEVSSMIPDTSFDVVWLSLHSFQQLRWFCPCRAFGAMLDKGYAVQGPQERPSTSSAVYIQRKQALTLLWNLLSSRHCCFCFFSYWCVCVWGVVLTQTLTYDKFYMYVRHNTLMIRFGSRPAVGFLPSYSGMVYV